MRQLASPSRRPTAAEDALADALAAVKGAEEDFYAASDRFDAHERILDQAREDRAQARRHRYAARQAYERASTMADRAARRARKVSDWLAEITTAAQPRAGRSEPVEHGFDDPVSRAPYSRHERTLIFSGYTRAGIGWP